MEINKNTIVNETTPENASNSFRSTIAKGSFALAKVFLNISKACDKAAMDCHQKADEALGRKPRTADELSWAGRIEEMEQRIARTEAKIYGSDIGRAKNPDEQIVRHPRSVEEFMALGLSPALARRMARRIARSEERLYGSNVGRTTNLQDGEND